MLKKYNQYSLFIIIIFALILLLITVLINLPFFLFSQKINQKLQAETAKQQTAATAGQGIDSTEFKILVNKIAAYENQFSAVGTELNLIVTLENIAKTANVTQKLTFNQTKKNTNERLITVPANIELEGNYTGIMNYLMALKTLKPRISAQSVELELAEETALLKAKLAVETYWLK